MTDKLNFSQIQDFQLNLADKALKEAQAELDALRAENERLRALLQTTVEVIEAYPHPLYEVQGRHVYNGLLEDIRTALRPT